MDKFQRNYRLEVQGGDGKVYVFNYPLTLQFSVQRAALASSNTATLKIYNLGQNTRNAIYKDVYDTETFRSVKLMAGYGDSLSEVLNGNVQEAKSYRESGSTNYITELNCFDWSFAMINAESDFTRVSALRSQIINLLVNDMVRTGVKRGVISNNFDSLDSATAFPKRFIAKGNTWKLLNDATNNHCFIDNGAVNCLLDNDCFIGDIPVIDSSTGLLSTPKKSDFMLKVDILFEPAVKIGQQVELISASESLYNGTYKVIGIGHNGVISGAVNGKCVTSLILNAGKYKLDVVSGTFSNIPNPMQVTV
jgi:hypothetical protein